MVTEEIHSKSVMASPVRPTLKGHIQIARIDHWFKNVFVFPGVVAAWGIDPQHVAPNIWMRPQIGRTR